MSAAPFTYDDGGRAAAGYTGMTGDCVVRAVAIAASLPYEDVYGAMYAATLEDPRLMRRLQRQYGERARRYASPRTGVYREVWRAYLDGLGWKWTATMGIGTGCRVHLRADELPGGALIVQVSKHVTAVLDGIVHDTYDPSRDGTRCVYGYYSR